MPQTLLFTSFLESLLKTLFSVRVIEMLKERKLWYIVESLEHSNALEGFVLEDDIVKKALSQLGLILSFRDKTEVVKTLQTLCKSNHLETHGEVIGHRIHRAYITNPASGDYFYLAYYWHKPIDAFGFIKFLTVFSIGVTLFSALFPQSVPHQYLIHIYNTYIFPH